MFARHLPPSAGAPRVLALDEGAAAEVAGLARVSLALRPADWSPGPFDAVVGPASPAQIEALYQRLRPGGRLILSHDAEPERLLAALTRAGLIHCLTEPHGQLCLYRGERPPEGSTVARLQALAAGEPLAPHEQRLPITSHSSLTTPFVFLLITQVPNRPAWKLAPDERVAWHAATLLPGRGEKPALLAFSALVKAVAFMQGAVLARRLEGVNKVGKFPATAAQAWALPLALNPDFDLVRDLAPGPPFEVDPRAAITGDE